MCRMKEEKSEVGVAITAAVFLVLILVLALPFNKLKAQDSTCGSLENAYGPYDYTNADHRLNKIPIVIGAHFTSDVQTLRSGASGRATPGPDIDYTLRAIPNHHEALYAMALLEFKTGKSPPPGSRYTVDCWFDRAKRFAPTDGMVYMIHGIYLRKKGKLEQAKSSYQEAIRLLPEAAEAHYNLGLLYFETGELESALEEAHKAYEGGFPLKGLKRKLEAKGAWRDSYGGE